MLVFSITCWLCFGEKNLTQGLEGANVTQHSILASGVPSLGSGQALSPWSGGLRGETGAFFTCSPAMNYRYEAGETPSFIFSKLTALFRNLVSPQSIESRPRQTATRCHPNPAVGGEGLAWVDQASGFLTPSFWLLISG